MSIESNTPPQTTGYLLLFRGSHWYSQVSESEVPKVMDKIKAWFDHLSATGKLAAAQPLFDEGVVISGKGGRTVTDGPFSEAKEVIGGYVMLTVKTQEEAVAIAQSNPMHEYGLVTE